MAAYHRLDVSEQPDALERFDPAACIWLVFRDSEVSNHRLTRSQLFDAYATAPSKAQDWPAKHYQPSARKWQFADITVLLCAL